MRNIAVAVVMVMLVAAAGGDSPVMVVDDGEPAACIVVPKEASPYISRAVDELVDCVKEATGAELQVVTEPIAGISSIHVGETAVVRAMDLQIAQGPALRSSVRPRQQRSKLTGRAGVVATEPRSVRNHQPPCVDTGPLNKPMHRLRAEWPAAPRIGHAAAPRPGVAGPLQQTFGKQILAVLAGAAQDLGQRRRSRGDHVQRRG